MGDKKGSRKGGEGGNGKDCRSGRKACRLWLVWISLENTAGTEGATSLTGSGIATGVVVIATDGPSSGVLGAGRQVAASAGAGVGVSMAACNLAISSKHSAGAVP